MKPANFFILGILLLTVGAIVFFVNFNITFPKKEVKHEQTRDDSCLYKNISTLQVRYFRHQHYIDSTNTVINQEYQYDKPIVGCMYSGLYGRIYSQIPFYGMFDGKRGFVYSTFFKEIKSIRVMFLFNDYYVATDQNNIVYILSLIEQEKWNEELPRRWKIKGEGGGNGMV